MAILQSRMIALINAAADYQRAYNSQRQSILDAAVNIARGRTTPEAAIADLHLMAERYFHVEDPQQSSAVIAAEHYHFTHNQRRNARRAVVTARKRRERGIPQRGIATPPETSKQPQIISEYDFNTKYRTADPDRHRHGAGGPRQLHRIIAVSPIPLTSTKPADSNINISEMDRLVTEAQTDMQLEQQHKSYEEEHKKYLAKQHIINTDTLPMDEQDALDDAHDAKYIPNQLDTIEED